MSEFAFVQLHRKATTAVAGDFLRALFKAVPYKVHTALTDNEKHFTDPAGGAWMPAELKTMMASGEPFRAHVFEYACACDDIDHRLTEPKHPWTNGQASE